MTRVESLAGKAAEGRAYLAGDFSLLAAVEEPYVAMGRESVSLDDDPAAVATGVEREF